MSKQVSDFSKAQKKLMKYFKCPDDYFVKVLDDCRWSISENEGMSFLSYWEGEKRQNAVIVKNSEGSLIYEVKNETMVVAIDCVKIAFIFKNSKKI
ncbi:MAG: hypothetical protein FWD82_01690 [Defluviitaleaceae bacterium]|nr:hypothetical protein [Defluviitaleaceae bacterium]